MKKENTQEDNTKDIVKNLDLLYQNAYSLYSKIGNELYLVKNALTFVNSIKEPVPPKDFTNKVLKISLKKGKKLSSLNREVQDLLKTQPDYNPEFTEVDVSVSKDTLIVSYPILDPKFKDKQADYLKKLEEYKEKLSSLTASNLKNLNDFSKKLSAYGEFTEKISDLIKNIDKEINSLKEGSSLKKTK